VRAISQHLKGYNPHRLVSINRSLPPSQEQFLSPPPYNPLPTQQQQQQQKRRSYAEVVNNNTTPDDEQTTMLKTFLDEFFRPPDECLVWCTG
jgi:hypothetical protein